jgi:predicted PilT family ATPase
VTSFFTKKVEYEIYTFGEQIVVMPVDWENKVKSWSSKIGEYAKHTINQKLQSLIPCDFLVKVKGTSLDIYVPEFYKGRVIGKWWASINELEKTVGLKINVKTFDDLPLLEAKVHISEGKNSLTIGFPDERANKQVSLIIGDELLQLSTDAHGIINIKEKPMIKSIQKKWFVIVDTDKL